MRQNRGTLSSNTQSSCLLAVVRLPAKRLSIRNPIGGNQVTRYEKLSAGAGGVISILAHLETPLESLI